MTTKYWVWLTQRTGLGTRRIAALLEHFGSAEAVFEADEPACAEVEGLSRACIPALMDKGLEEAEKTLEQCDRKGIRILTFGDDAYPKRLQNISDPPAVLYYQGHVPKVDELPLITVVGSRKASAYGNVCARQFGSQLAKAGCTVVSGGAAGIDTMGLTGAMAAGGQVVCVLGCGVDVAYPRANRDLFRDIAASGWLVSEYPPGTPPNGHHFPVRNRILSGLSVGVVVVEAGERSGALITASLALEQGRDVFAVPGNVDIACAKGSNRLLKEGAILAESGWEVAQEYEALFPDKIHRPQGLSPLQEVVQQRRSQPPQIPAARVAEPKTTPSRPTVIDVDKLAGQVSETEQTILRQLQGGTVHVDELISRTGLPASRVLAALTMLEVRHFVEQRPGKLFSLAKTQS